MTSEPQFQRVRGAVDRHEIMTTDGQWWTVAKIGSRWTILDPTGNDVGGDVAKGKAFDMCRIAMSGTPLAPPTPPRTGTRAPVSAAESAHRDRVRALGCAINDQYCGGIVHYHHVNPRADFRGIGLCAEHHQNSNVVGVAYHKGRESFQDRYGSQEDLLALVTERLADVDALAERLMRGEVIA